MFNRLLMVNASELEWEDDRYLKLPKGIKSKVLLKDEEAGAIDLLLFFERDYEEPAHTHASTHRTVVLKGRIEHLGDPRKVVEEGGFVFGPSNVEHGPYRFPAGTLLFIHFEGDPAHRYETPR